jgi:excisionase family DNA binding protein
MAPDHDPELTSKSVFTTGEAARLCGVSQQTIIRCFDAGRLDGFRVPGSKFRRIPRDALLRFMGANGMATEALEGSSRRVLIVDDDPAIVDIMHDILAEDGRFEIETAATGYDAGLLTERFRPHLVVLDYMLPDINGNLVCERIRAHTELTDVRVLCVSGVVRAGEVENLLQAGADAFLRKPFDLTEFLDHVVSLSGLGDQNGRSSQQQPGSERPDQGTEGAA